MTTPSSETLQVFDNSLRHSIKEIPQDSQSAALLLLRVRQKRLPNPFHLRECVKKGWTGLRQTDDVERAVENLVSAGMATHQLVKPDGGGRPRRIVTIIEHSTMPEVVV